MMLGMYEFDMLGIGRVFPYWGLAVTVASHYITHETTVSESVSWRSDSFGMIPCQWALRACLVIGWFCYAESPSARAWANGVDHGSRSRSSRGDSHVLAGTEGSLEHLDLLLDKSIGLGEVGGGGCVVDLLML